jgi:hypothetical protein
MRHPVARRRLLLLWPFLTVACTLSLLRSPLPGPTPLEESPTVSSTPEIRAATEEQAAATPRAAPTSSSPTVGTPASFCTDPRPLVLIEKFKEAVSAADGALLAELVSPQHGMDARLLRDGRVVNYDREHAAALFDSTYVVDWGIAPGSGLATRGPFRELFVPDLMDVLSKAYSPACNRIQVGGATYTASWPYEGSDFYSLHYAGSSEYGSLDWHTWVIGIHLEDDRHYLYAIMQFKWEP